MNLDLQRQVLYSMFRLHLRYKGDKTYNDIDSEFEKGLLDTEFKEYIESIALSKT